MKKYKYTEDGHKVIVIKELNKSETIVQKIVIIGGEEKPNGVSFISKKLFNEPLETWKEKNLREIEERYEKEYSIFDEKLRKQKKHYRELGYLFREKIEYIKKAVDQITPETFDLLADYITGKIKFVVVDEYNLKIHPFDEFNELYEERLRLISFFGKDDGSFRYKIGQYYDWSGSNKTFYPCRSYEEALAVVQTIFDNKKKYYDDDIKTALKYIIKLDKTKFDKHQNDKIESLNKQIKKSQEDLAKLKDNLSLVQNIEMGI